MHTFGYLTYISIKKSFTILFMKTEFVFCAVFFKVSFRVQNSIILRLNIQIIVIGCRKKAAQHCRPGIDIDI